MTARHRIVRVPASSANLGPGYDVMAAALDLHLELEIAETGEFSFDPGPVDIPDGRDNLLVRAFETLHPADGIGFHLREAHNDYLQLAAEGGLLLGAPIVFTAAALMRDVRQRFAGSHGSSYWIRLGAVAGLGAIALQSTVEFSLQMPGNAALCAVLGGIALHRDPRSTRAVTRDGEPSGLRATRVLDQRATW